MRFVLGLVVGDVNLGQADAAFLLRGAASTKKLEISYNRLMTITVDLPPEVAASLAHKAAQEGQNIAYYLQQIAVREAQTMPQEPLALRTPGLHAGQYWIAEDFDAPCRIVFGLVRKTQQRWTADDEP